MIILYNFDSKMGVKVFYSYPKELLDINIINDIAKMMDISIKDGYTILITKDKYIYNFYFEIDSAWARGKREMLLLSIVFDKRISIEKEKRIVEECYIFINNIKLKKNIFMGFYNDKNIICNKKKLLIEFEIRKLSNLF
jgi:hypothetical protein